MTEDSENEVQEDIEMDKRENALVEQEDGDDVLNGVFKDLGLQDVDREVSLPTTDVQMEMGMIVKVDAGMDKRSPMAQDEDDYVDAEVEEGKPLERVMPSCASDRVWSSLDAEEHRREVVLWDEEELDEDGNTQEFARDAAGRVEGRDEDADKDEDES
jgi:hypothetical protein